MEVIVELNFSKLGKKAPSCGAGLLKVGFLRAEEFRNVNNKWEVDLHNVLAIGLGQDGDAVPNEGEFVQFFKGFV